MRNLLREKDVYVRKRHGIIILNTLYEVVKEDLEWPEEEEKYDV